MATRMVREGGALADKFQAIFPGVSQVLTVEADALRAYISIGETPAPQTAASRFPIGPNAAEYFGVKPGEKVGARTGTTSATSTVFSDGVTIVRVFYDDENGVVYVTEGGSSD